MWPRCTFKTPCKPPWLELEGAAIPRYSSIREFQKGHAHYLAEALEQPLLLPKDMTALKNMRKPDLFLSLKRDLALVSLCTFSTTKSFFLFLFNNILVCYSYASRPGGFHD